MATPLLGWIAPRDRTEAQNNGHALALAMAPRFALPRVVTAGPVKVMLTDFWKAPLTVADVGFAFNGFRQLTGSCVGVSEGNAIATLGFVQRHLAADPTKAFVPFWPFPYGRTRFREGDRGQGEGAVVSIMGTTLMKEGVFAATEVGLPKFDTRDGLALTSHEEYQWSDGGTSLVTQWSGLARVHLLRAQAPLYSTDDIKTSVLNGYPVLNGCDNYIGTGAIHGSGVDAYVRGRYDGRGGHATGVLGYWDHPNDGPLFLYSNQWDGSTYPTDPAGAGRCCVWTPESEMAKLFRTGGDNGETMAFSHLDWFPAQVDQVLDFTRI